MGGMGGLYIGASGLQSSQNALNTTAHNLANISTKGYVRQQVLQSDTIYSTIGYSAVGPNQLGLGSKVAQVAQVRDYFLDQSYRQEAGRASYYGTAYDSYYEIETILSDMEGAEFFDSLSELKAAFDKISTDPTDASYLAYLKQKVVKFIENSQNVYEGLSNYQDSLNEQAIDTIDDINELSHAIYDLNFKIASIEAGGVEHANDLRDERNKAIDELSALINISYVEDKNGIITISAEGVPLVDDSFVNEITYTTDRTTGFITPAWSMMSDQPVFDLNIIVSTDKNTDIGKLKSLLMQRGDYLANYTDIPDKSNYQDDSGNWLAAGTWEINGDTYNDGKSAYNAKLSYYNERIFTSAVMSTMAQVDKLVHGIVTTMNDMLCPNTTFTPASDVKDSGGNVIFQAGETYTILDTDNCSVGANKEMGVELFSRNAVDRYTVYTDDSNNVYYVYNEESETREDYMYSIMGITVNEQVKENASSLPFYKQNGEVDYEGAAKLIEAWDKDFSVVDPNDSSAKNFIDFYTGVVGQTATKGRVYYSLMSKSESTVNTVESNRQMVMGVSSDEELSNMIKYQNAYNAASRYITTVSDMLEHLVTSLGR